MPLSHKNAFAFSMTSTTLKRTPLYQIHKQLGARIVDFAGWEMPVQYDGLMEEHHAVRKHSGMFDVSHMGELLVHGPKAEALVQRATCNDVSGLPAGSCQYSAFLNAQGTFVDDVIVNKITPERFLICVNASNAEKDFQWIKTFESAEARVENVSDNYFQIAVQGPEACGLIPHASLPEKPFTFIETVFEGHECLIARTGYTGEDGVEIYGRPQDAESVWSYFLEKGVRPCGLGARDTLRLESCLPLYGHEIDDQINPFEAGLSWIVKMDKGDFIGREALSKAKNDLRKKLVGICMEESGFARQGCKIFDETGEKEIGIIVSGTKSPTLNRAIATGFVTIPFSETGKQFRVDIHHKKRQAVVTSRPFYKRKNKS